jgi:hypothetical protein
VIVAVIDPTGTSVGIFSEFGESGPEWSGSTIYHAPVDGDDYARGLVTNTWKGQSDRSMRDGSQTSHGAQYACMASIESPVAVPNAVCYHRQKKVLIRLIAKSGEGQRRGCLMNRLALVLVVLVLLSGHGATASKVANQVGATPAVDPMSEPVEVGDWTFQVVDLERLDRYYAEMAAEVFEPEGVYLIVGVALTYNGASVNQLDRYTGGFFQLTGGAGEIYDEAEVHATFSVEESYRADLPYPPLPANGVAEPGVKHYDRYIFDVPPDATGLALSSGPLAPMAFSIPLPDPADIDLDAQWELEVLDATMYETLGPPLTGSNQYQAQGIYLVVDVRLTRLRDEAARLDPNWFALQTGEGETIPIASAETIELGPPLELAGNASAAFALVFDVPPGLDDPTLVSTPGAPLAVEIPLNADIAPPPTATPSPTPTATSQPTATVAPTLTATLRPTATSSPRPLPTATPAPTATTAPTALPTATPRPTAMPTVSSEPGAIRVVTRGDGDALPPNASGAVEIIFDTSGSMLQPMGDQLRIDVAKDVLTDLVTTKLPAGTQTALRVFGTVPGSCETSLAIPLGPLDPVSSASTVASIQAIDEVRTPLGASLEAAGADLQEVEGPRLIVLITDGEETCDGDPGAVISALAAQGVDVRVNIVGFAINDPQIEGTLAAWAEQGGGQYFAAADAEDLGTALIQALQPTFDVQDSDGFTVGTGIVNGDAVPVPPGRYTVVVNTAPPTTIERVVVTPGKTTEVELVPDG